MPLSRAIRRSLIAAAIAAALVVAAAIALPFLVDVNRFRPLIAARVQEATGRTITLGKISFSLLPTPALSVGGPIRISDSAAYPGRSALTADSLRVRVGLLGLLRGRANVTSIHLSRPTVTLIRDPRGRWNFDDLVERASAASRAAPQKGAVPESSFRVVVDQARVSGGRIVIYDDSVVAGRRSEAVIDRVDATIRGWGGDQPTDMNLSLGLGKSALTAQARLSASDAGPVLALNARGTLGVLLASVTLAAGIINEKFFAALVLVSILTCQLAGVWLNRAFRPRRTTMPVANVPRQCIA